MSTTTERDRLPDEIRGLPPLPQALVRVFEIIRDETASLSDLEEIIYCDQALAAKILQIANSAYYGVRGKVSTLSRAVITMGIHEVKSICLSFLLTRHLFGEDSGCRSAKALLWKHSLAVAKIAREIVGRRPWIDGEEAYALGLLHDMGRLGMLVYYHEDYARIQAADARKLPLWEDECRYGFDHARVGKWIAIRWALPEVCRRVMEWHHTPVECSPHVPIVMIVHLADLLAQYRERPELTAQQSVLDCCRELCIPDEEWQRHIKRTESLWKEVEQLWAWLG